MSNRQKDKHMNSTMENMKPTQRTGEGLRDALFDEIDKLRDGTGNPTHAIAVAKLACQIVNIVKVEVEYQRHVQAQRTLGNEAQDMETIRLGRA